MDVAVQLILALVALQLSSVDSQSSAQSFLDAFCASNRNNPGCSSTPPITEGFPSSGVPGSQQGSCLQGTKRCPQLPLCVPNDVPCSVLGSNIQCETPRGINTVIRVLVCGDGSGQGSICGTDKSVPLMTLLIVQCLSQGELITDTLLQSLGVRERPGSEKGAGVYLCDTTQNWRPLAGSPPLDPLIRSCLNAGCGYVPEPTAFMRVDRPWSWIRTLYFNDRPTCTVSIVSNDAVITAAHCVTTSPGSRDIPINYNIDFTIELPNYKVKPNHIYIHPNYDPKEKYVHDIAVITFKRNDDFVLPTVCIADDTQGSSSDRLQVISVLAENRATPEWLIRESSWSTDCRRLSPGDRFCQDQLTMKQSQFCAKYEGIGITTGSSGGPYLAEVGQGVEEVWVMQGVLSNLNNNPSCSRSHLVFSSVAEDSKWLKDCVFYRECNTFFSTAVGFL